MDDTARTQLAALADWITSADAGAAAASECRGRGLPDLSDDVTQQTYEQVAARIRRGGPIPLEPGASIAGYARRAMHNIVSGLLRGRTRDTFEDDTVTDLPDRAPDLADALAADAAVDALRHQLFATLDPGNAWSTSAALTFVTLATDPPRVDGIGPHPDAGAEGQDRYWTALWVAGQYDCFADADAATRQRRARAIKRVTAQLAHAWEAT